MTTKDEIQAALVDVRRAYRLLYLYQRRVIDLAKQTADSFDKRFYLWTNPRFERQGRYSITYKNSPFDF